MTTQIDPLLDIQTKVLRATFVNNMAVLKKYMPDVFNFYQNYTPTRVKLTFDGSGHLNLVSNGNLIYQDDPKKSSEQQVKAFIENPHNIVYHVARDGNGAFEHENILLKIVEHREKEVGTQTKITFPKDEQIDFIAFMGTGLGYHLQSLFDEYDIRYAFVYEPDPDCFYCTLHCIDIGNMIKACFEKGGQLTLQVGGNSNGFVNEIAKIFKSKGYFNVAKMFLYRHYFSKETDDAFQQVHDIAHRYVGGWGFGEDEIISLTHTLTNISTYKFPSILQRAKEFKRDLPVFIVGNGPSLDESITYLKNNQNKGLIFSSGTALKPLLDNGIIPDFHIETERTALLFDWIDRVGHKDKLKEIDIIALNTVYPEVLKLFKQAYLLLKPSDTGSAFMEKFISQKYTQVMFCNPTVTNTASAAAIAMGFKNLYLFGVDYGFKSAVFHHSKDSLYFKENDELNLGAEIKEELEVTGNFEEKVFTTQIFDGSRMVLEMLLQENPDVNCINTSDGVRIQLTTPCRSADLPHFSDLNNKSILIEELLRDSFDNTMYQDTNLVAEFKKLLPKMNAYLKQLLLFSKGVKSRIDLTEAFSAQYKFLNDFEHDRIKMLLHRFLSGSLNYFQSNIMSNVYLYSDKQQQQEYIVFCLKMMRDHFEWLFEELKNNYDKPSKI